jgi:hypothetical protein
MASENQSGFQMVRLFKMGIGYQMAGYLIVKKEHSTIGLVQYSDHYCNLVIKF